MFTDVASRARAAVSHIGTPRQETEVNNIKQKRNSVAEKQQKFSSDALELEINLTERLKEFNKTESPYVMTNDKFSVYQKIFSEVIDRDKNFGSLLMKIKGVYDEQLNETDTSQPDIDRIIAEIREIK